MKRFLVTTFTILIAVCTHGFNQICDFDTDRINVMSGTWEFDKSDCSLFTNDTQVSTVWFGDWSGTVPDPWFKTLSSFKATLSVSVYDNIVNENICLIFRSPVNNEWYCFGYSVYSNWIYIALFEPSWSGIESTWSYPIHTHTMYDLTIICNDTHYMAYVNDLLVFEHYNLTHFTSGTFGIRSARSAAKFYSLIIEPYNYSTPTPTSVPTDSPTVRPSEAPNEAPSMRPSRIPTIEPSKTRMNSSEVGDGEENNNDNSGSENNLGTFETIVIILLCGICFLFITLNIAAFWCVWMKKKQSQELSLQLYAVQYACCVQGY